MPIVPQLEALPVEGTEFIPSTVRDSFDGSGPEVLTYPQWLERQPARVQRDVLGATRFRLFRDGNANLRAFVNDRGRQLTLEELRLRSPQIFEAAGL